MRAPTALFRPGRSSIGRATTIDCITQRHHTLFAFILPFIEQTTIYNSINFQLGSMDTTVPTERR